MTDAPKAKPFTMWAVFSAKDGRRVCGPYFNEGDALGFAELEDDLFYQAVLVTPIEEDA